MFEFILLWLTNQLELQRLLALHFLLLSELYLLLGFLSDFLARFELLNVHFGENWSVVEMYEVFHLVKLIFSFV